MIEIPLKKMTCLKSQGKIMVHILIKRQVEEGVCSLWPTCSSEKCTEELVGHACGRLFGWPANLQKYEVAMFTQLYPAGQILRDEISQNHRMVWVGRDLTDQLVPTPVPWAPSTRPGCSKPHPT